MNEQEALVLLNMVPGIGLLRFKNLMQRFGSASNVFKAGVQELKAVPEISRILAEKIFSCKWQYSLLQDELETAKANGIEIITLNHPQYPPCLREIFDAPPVLYVKGEISVLSEPSIAVVGTRAPTLYGLRSAKALSRQLAQARVVTVSGLARGIDTAAHQATLESSGKTVAVLGGGLLKLYPPENKKLSEAIATSGAVISEFHLHCDPEPGCFPRRNRIISALSYGTVVVEGRVQSGALITAKIALEQGKDVFAVPGPIDSPMSLGPNSLIQQGAVPVLSIADVLTEIAPLREKFYSSALMNKMESPKNVSTPQEQGILNLFGDESLTADILLGKSGLPMGEFSKLVLNLEMKGRIQSLPGKRYVRI